MTDFRTRALDLAERISADPENPALDSELDQLRARWRSLDGPGRVEAAPAARALSHARARRATGPALTGGDRAGSDDDSEAQLALQGLDRIAVDAPAPRVYRGPPEPDALLEHFGHGQFRPGQREAVQAALAGRDSLVVMPTGGGKSLCYQLPAVASPDLTVVVSPLIALIADQYRRLVLGGHPATMVASGMDERATIDALEAVGGGHARIVLCSPERFASGTFMAALSRRVVDLFVVDEAHCVSEWGHDFRPDYLRLRAVIDRLGSPPVMACTATATEQVAQEIRGRLGLSEPFVVRSGFDRPNLSFDVIALEGRGSRARKHMLLCAALADPAHRPSIVYCGTRKDVEEVSQRLRASGLQAVGYHAGMAADERASGQHRFMADDADVVVATNAFGMGVDKADVRSVIHWAIPKSVEAYYQEVGRAGRDGAPARAILLAMRADLGRLINFIERDRIDADDVLAYLQRLGRGGAQAVIDAPRDNRERVCLGVAERAGALRLEPAPGSRLRVTLTGAPDARAVASICDGARDRGWRAYRAVETFVSSTATCRRRALLDHFGDARPGAPLGRCCDVCDPQTTGLPDAASLIPPKPAREARVAVAVNPADSGLLEQLKDWRTRASDGKPAYTVAHNSTLETIAALRPSTLEELAAINGVGPTFLKRHADEVLALVADGVREGG